MKRTILIAIAAAGLTFAAAPSYAQSSYGGGSGGSFGNNSVDNIQRDAERAQRRAEKQARRDEKRRLKADKIRLEAEQAEIRNAAQLQTPSSAVDAKTLNSTSAVAQAIQSPSSASSRVTFQQAPALPVSCPSGTEPQTDGTCMLK